MVSHDKYANSPRRAYVGEIDDLDDVVSLTIGNQTTFIGRFVIRGIGPDS